MDTGSTVSTVSESFYRQHLTTPLITIDRLLDIECADGQQLPYLGYIEAELQIPGQKHQHQCILLVTPNSRYNAEVPLLLGTNILTSMMDTLREEHGERFLQARITTPWYLAFRCVHLREKELQKNKNRLGVVRNAEGIKITIPPNTVKQITCNIDKEIPYHTTPAILQTSDLAKDSDDLDIEPSVINYQHKMNGPITVRVSNITTRTICIPPKAIVCEIQPVTLENNPQPSSEEITNILDQMEITKSNLTEDQFQQGIQLITSFMDIFSKTDDDVGHTDTVKHRIDLTDDKPFKQRYRRIPPSAYEEVRAHLRQLQTAGIIRPSRSPWASNVVLVRKKDNTLRLCVDYRQLNKITKKDSYALPRIEELLDCLGGSTFFSVVDMKSGYHQVEILEQHKERTAFAVGPL